MNKLTNNCEACHLVKLFEEIEQEKRKQFIKNQIREIKYPEFLKRKQFNFHLISAN